MLERNGIEASRHTPVTVSSKKPELPDVVVTAVTYDICAGPPFVRSVTSRVPWSGLVPLVIGLICLPALMKCQTNTFPTSGNAGVGTTSPVTNFQVTSTSQYSSFLLGNPAGPTSLDFITDVCPAGGCNNISSNAYFNGTWNFRNTGYEAWLLGLVAGNTGNGRVVLSHSPSGTLTWTNDLYINSSGQIGIGPAIPQALLHVNEVGSTNLDFIGILNNANNSAGTGYGVGLRLQNSNIAAGGNEQYKWAGIAAVASRSYSNNTNLAFYSGNYSSSTSSTSPPTERMRIQSTTGNVGIGTTNPTNKTLSRRDCSSL